jgi:soluble lytic murein transglycosylase-like protein
MATSSIAPGQPYIALMTDQAALELPVSSSAIQQLIDFDAMYYGVSAPLMRGIIARESAFNQYAVNDHPPREVSVGLVQINLLANRAVTRAEALSPVFSINYLAQHLADGEGDKWSTYKAALADASP